MIAGLPRIDKLNLSVTSIRVIDCEILMGGNNVYMMGHTHALFATHSRCTIVPNNPARYNLRAQAPTT